MLMMDLCDVYVKINKIRLKKQVNEINHIPIQ